MAQKYQIVDGSFNDVVTGADVAYVISFELEGDDVVSFSVDFRSAGRRWRSPPERLEEACPLDVVAWYAREIAVTALFKRHPGSKPPVRA